MIKAKITKLYNNISTSKFFEIPQKFEEIKDTSLIKTLVSFLSKCEHTKAKLYLLQKIINDNTYFFNMQSEQIASITKQFQFLNEDAIHSTPFFNSFRHNSTRYYFPRAEFENGTSIEFALAHQYYYEFINEKKTDSLIYLTATLAREREQSRKEQILRADIRVPIHDASDEVIIRAKKFKKLPFEYQFAAFKYFEAIESILIDIGKKSGIWEREQSDNLPNNSPNTFFDWRIVLRAIAEEGPFKGGYEEVCQRKFWEIVQILIDKNQVIQKMQKR